MNYENLVNGIKQKDNASIVEFYNEFYKDVYYVCYKITGNEKDAEDVAQETLFRAINKIDLLEPVDRLPAWLRTIANNLSINYIKKNRKFNIADDCDVTDDNLFDDASLDKKTPEEIVADKEVADILMGMIDKLPEEQRITIFMFYYEEMSVKEISEAMDCSEATVRSRINYAKKALRKQVEELENKGVKLRCMAILPFLFTIYSFEKYAVASELSLPDIQTVYANNKSVNSGGNMIKNNITKMALGTKIAIGAASVAVVAGLVVGGIALTNKDFGKSDNTSNVTQSANDNSGDSNETANGNSNNSENNSESQGNGEMPPVNLDGLDKSMYVKYEKGEFQRGEIGVLKYYKGMWDTLRSAEGVNAHGYVCYIEEETKNLICVNPSNDEELYRVDIGADYKFDYTSFGSNYVTMEVQKEGEDARILAYNLNNGKKVIDIGILDKENERPTICPASDGLVLMYYDITDTNRKVLSYSLYDAEGNITNPCTPEMMEIIDSTCSYYYVTVGTDEWDVNTYYRPDTFEQILIGCDIFDPMCIDENYCLVKDYKTKELYLISRDEDRKISEEEVIFHYKTDGAGNEYAEVYGLLLTDENGKRMLYSFKESLHIGIGEHFTDNFITNSSQTAMAYIGDDGKYYYYDIKNNTETELDLNEGTMLISVAKDKMVYAEEADGGYVFTKLDIKNGEKTELEATGKLIEDYPYEVIEMECTYNEEEIEIFIHYNFYDEEYDEWYGMTDTINVIY